MARLSEEQDNLSAAVRRPWIDRDGHVYDLALQEYGDGDTVGEKGAIIEAHIAVCEICRTYLADWRELREDAAKIAAEIDAMVHCRKSLQ